MTSVLKYSVYAKRRGNCPGLGTILTQRGNHVVFAVSLDFSSSWTNSLFPFSLLKCWRPFVRFPRCCTIVKLPEALVSFPGDCCWHWSKLADGTAHWPRVKIQSGTGPKIIWSGNVECKVVLTLAPNSGLSLFLLLFSHLRRPKSDWQREKL